MKPSPHPVPIFFRDGVALVPPPPNKLPLREELERILGCPVDPPGQEVSTEVASVEKEGEDEAS